MSVGISFSSISYKSGDMRCCNNVQFNSMRMRLNVLNDYDSEDDKHYYEYEQHQFINDNSYDNVPQIVIHIGIIFRKHIKNFKKLHAYFSKQYYITWTVKVIRK